jgi:hypothetical protein
MWPSFQGVRAKTPKYDKRMQVYSAEIESFDAAIQKLMPHDFKQLNGRGCSPMFIVLRKGEVVAAVEGCNSPVVEAAMFKYMPPPIVGGADEH